MDNNNELINRGAAPADTTAPGYLPKFDPMTGCPIQQQEEKTQYKETKEKASTESIIGKYILPICASLMILVGICYFAITLWENIPDGFKALIIAGIALVPGTLGFLLRKKDNLTVFRTILIAIALAILYVDAVVAYISWKLVSALVFVLIIMLWSVACIGFGALLKQQIYHFCSITGIIISAFFWTSVSAYTLNDFIIIWTLLASFMLIAVSYKKLFGRLSFIMGIGGTILIGTVLLAVYDCLFGEGENIMGVFIQISAFLFAILFTMFYRFIAVENHEKVRDVEKILCFFETVILGLIMTLFNNGSAGFSYPNLAAVAIFCLAACLSGVAPAFTISAALLPLSITCIQISDHILGMEYPGLVILSGILLIIFLFCKNKMFTIIAIISQAMLQFVSLALCSDGENYVDRLQNAKYFRADNTLTIVFIFIIIASVLSALYTIAFMKKSGAGFYSPSLSGTLTQALICSITLNKITFPYGTNYLPYVIVMPLAFICLIAFTMKRCRDITENKIPFDLYFQPIVFNIAAVILYVKCDSIPVSIVLGILVFASLAVMFLGSDMKHRLHNGSLAAMMSIIYIDYFILISTTEYLKKGFLLSIGILLIATAYIIFGFVKKTKITRIYGLIAILAAIAKMMLFDINTDETAIRVASLIGGGIICLIISFIYIRLEKKLEEEA